MATIRVFPVEGRLVRHPETKQPISVDGIDVDDTDPFWFRRLSDGDVTVAQVSPPAAPTKRGSPTVATAEE